MGVMTAIAAVGVGSALIAGNQQRQAAKGQAATARQNRDLIAGVLPPELEDLEYELANPELVGEYSPELLQEMALGDTEFLNVSPDEKILEEQNEALQQLDELSQGGLSEADIAAAREINRNTQQQAQANRQTILRNMAQRGVLGSGQELAAQLAGQQEVANRQAQESDRLIQQAQQRALQALNNKASMTNSMRGQDFDEQARKAQAIDAIREYNARNSQAVQNQNVANANAAAQQNLSNRQQIANAAVNNLNEQRRNTVDAVQQNYNNELARAKGIAGMNSEVANARAAQSQANANTIGSVGSAIVGGIAGGFGGGAAKLTPATGNTAMNFNKDKYGNVV